jgi:predicted enzyme related to lactoylglutathione lyase
MPERTSYPEGAPCWVDLFTTDLSAALAFYGALFGWERLDASRSVQEGGGFELLTLRGRIVTAIGRSRDATQPPAWSTYLAVGDVDAAVARATPAGATILFGPRDVGDAGRMVMLADPTGAAVGLWQARARIGAELRDEPDTLGWNELTTRDVETAKAFYSEVLAMRPVAWEGGSRPYTVWHVNGETVGGLMQMDEGWPPETPPHWAVCFVVRDAEATAAQAAALGGAVRVAPFDIPDVGVVALLVDPHGAGFSIMEPTALPDE